MTIESKPKEMLCSNRLCRICGARADLIENRIYVCQADQNHMGDTTTGIFTDLTPPEKGERER